MIWIGIDPGLRSGAIAAVDHNGHYIGAYDIAAVQDRIDARALKQMICGFVELWICGIVDFLIGQFWRSWKSCGIVDLWNCGFFDWSIS